MDKNKSKLRVIQIKGLRGIPQNQRLVVKGLGLRGRHSQVIVDNTPSFRGMIKKVIHLLQVEEIDG